MSAALVGGPADLTVAVGGDRALALCSDAIETALAAGADTAVASLGGRSGSHTRFAEDRVHQPQDITEHSLVVRAVVAGRAVRVATSDLTAGLDAARRAVQRARALAAAASPLPVPECPALAAAAGPGAPPLPPLWHDDTAGWDVGARTGVARAAMAAAQQAGGAAYGMLGQAATELAVVTSAGVERYAAATEALGTFTVRVEDGTSHWVDLDRSIGVLDLDAATARTIEEALAGRGRVELAPGCYDAVLGPLATGGLLEGVGAYGFTGTAVADGVGAVARRRGERVAPASVDIADNPSAARGLPFPFDVEGTPSVRVSFLDAGVVAGAVTDFASAARAGLPATGHAHVAREETPHATPASTTMAPGAASDAELVAGIERGIYVQRFWYLRVVDPAATTLTGGSRDACFLIEDGRLGRPLAPARFTESVFDVLGQVDGVGRDVLAQPLPNVWNGCVAAPAVRVRGFRFGPAGAGVPNNEEGSRP